MSRSCLDYSVQLDQQRRLRSLERALLLTLPAYLHFQHAYTPLILTCLAGVRCPRGIHHAWHALHRVRTHTLCVVLSSSHMPYVGSLFLRYPSCPACSSSRPYSHTVTLEYHRTVRTPVLILGEVCTKGRYVPVASYFHRWTLESLSRR